MPTISDLGEKAPSSPRTRCVTALRTRGWHDAARDFARCVADPSIAGEAGDPVFLEALLDARHREDALRAADLLEAGRPCAASSARDGAGRARASALDPAAEAALQEASCGPLADARVVLGSTGSRLAARWADRPGVDLWLWDPVDPSTPIEGHRARLHTLAPDDLPPADATVWIHPALSGPDREAALAWRARIRARAACAPADPSAPRRVLVVVGPRPFHVEAPLVDALRTLGAATAVARVHGDARDDAVADAVAHARPDRVISVNGASLVRAPALRCALEALEIPTVLWFVDEPDAALGSARASLAAPHVLALAWEREAVARLRRHGFHGANYLPHGTRWTTPVDPLPGAGNLLWIGTSYAGADRDALRGGAADPVPEGWNRAERRLAGERGLSLAGLREAMASDDPAADLVRQVALGDRVAAARRRNVARALTPLGLRIYGDRDGWTRLLGAGAPVLGDVDAATVFPRLVAGARLSVDCVHPQMPTAVTQRVFDVPACGGLVLADDRPDLREHFDVGDEVLAYTSPDHAAELARWALDRPSTRERIAAAAARRVAAEHTLAHRAGRLLALADAHFGRR